MSRVDDLLDEVVAKLQALQPGALVTREYVVPERRDDSLLANRVYNVLYSGYSGREVAFQIVVDVFVLNGTGAQVEAEEIEIVGVLDEMERQGCTGLLTDIERTGNAVTSLQLVAPYGFVMTQWRA